MTHFEDGPAVESKPLVLQRAPRFLRVVQDEKGAWDALDQLHDKPCDSEKVYAYELVGGAARCFIDSRKPGYSGPCVIACYRFVDQKPTEPELRSNEAWRAWTVAAAKTRKDLSNEMPAIVKSKANFTR